MPHLWPLDLRERDIRLRPLRRRDRRAYDHLRDHDRDWLQPWEATDPDSRRRRVDFPVIRRTAEAQGRTGVALTLAVLNRGVLVGQIAASPILYGAASSATLGYWIGREHAGHGTAPRAVALLVDHLFAELGLHRIEVNIRPENGASLRVAAKLGLREEGLRERFLHVDGQWRDHRSFALTSEEVPPGPDGRRLRRRLDALDRLGAQDGPDTPAQ